MEGWCSFYVFRKALTIDYAGITIGMFGGYLIVRRYALIKAYKHTYFLDLHSNISWLSRLF